MSDSASGRAPDTSSSPETSRPGDGPWRGRLPWLAAAALAVLALALGAARLGTARTDPFSERAVLEESLQIVLGRHRAGIVEFTHYPNGPTYAAVLLRELGVPAERFRLLPLTVSSLAAGALLLAWLRRAPSAALGVWACLAALLFVAQPGVSAWMGALHEHGYAFAWVLLAAALVSARPAHVGAALWALGFLAGWTGFDWLPGHAVVLFALAALAAVATGAPPLRGLVLAACDALRFVSGVAMAVITHVLQLVAYFGSVGEALRDLFGAAAVRMGTEAGRRVAPAYQHWLDEAGARVPEEALRRAYGPGFDLADPDRTAMLGHFFERFLALWAWEIGMGLALVIGLGLVFREARRRGGPTSWLRVLGLAAFAAFAAGLASCIWTVLMPQHAVFHAHILDRHFLLGALVLLGAVPLLGDVAAGGRTRPPPWPARRERGELALHLAVVGTAGAAAVVAVAGAGGVAGPPPG